jgi:hypothetical protein
MPLVEIAQETVRFVGEGQYEGHTVEVMWETAPAGASPLDGAAGLALKSPSAAFSCNVGPRFLCAYLLMGSTT